MSARGQATPAVQTRAKTLQAKRELLEEAAVAYFRHVQDVESGIFDLRSNMSMTKDLHDAAYAFGRALDAKLGGR